MGNRGQQTTISTFSVILTRRVEGFKVFRLDKVAKIIENTTLENNNLNLKKLKHVFSFMNGVSEDVALNDFIISICRYIKE